LALMGADQSEIVRRVYDAWTRGDRQAAVRLLHPDVEYVSPPDAVEPGTRRGMEGWEQATRSVAEMFSETAFTIERLIEEGDRVVAVTEIRFRGRSSGAEAARRQGHVWTFSEGKVARLEWFNEPEQAFAAAGIAAPPD
jgi:ketosteroid isomerase-like protein